MTSSSKEMNKEMKMDWMYRDSSQVVDPEEYLLGRKVDKQFEKSSLPPDKDQEPLPTSIFSLSVTENQVDIVRKLQEDPLYLIQKREIESREQLLKNPRKMKQLQEMLARQQAVAEKLKRKEMKKVKKLKKSKDLDSLLAKKCKKILGGFDKKKLVSLESDISSESSSNESCKYKKKNSGDLDKLLALKYKKLLGKVDPRKLVETSSSSESDSSSWDQKTEKKKKKKASSSSESKSSSDDQNIKRRPVENLDSINKASSRLKRNRLNDDSKRSRKRDSSDEVVGRKKQKPTYKHVKSKNRGSSCDSEVSHDDKKQKLHHKSKTIHKNRDFERENRLKSSLNERDKKKTSEKNKERDEDRDKDERSTKSKETSTHRGSNKSKTSHDKRNSKKSTNSYTDKYERKHGDYSDSSNSSCSKQIINKRDSGKHIKKENNKRHESNLSCSESKSKKPYEKSGKRETHRKTKLTSSSSSSDSDTSLSIRKCNQKKQYGLVLPANYVPKKASNTATEQLPSEEKNEVKPFRREEKRKLTEEEKEKRLQEMMNNAKWRDDLRDTNIKTYKKKLEAEKDDYVYSEDFMRKQMSLAMSQGTVESRVKAKINTIQRSKDAMSENFARRK